MKTRRRKRKRAKRDITEVREYIQATTSKTLNGDNNDGNNDNNNNNNLIMCKLRRTASCMRGDNSRAVTQLTADNFGISDIPVVITDGSPCSVHEDFNPPLQ